MTAGSVRHDHLQCLGMVETSTVPGGFVAFDALVKEAPVSVLDARPLTPAKYVVLFDGEVEAVRRAIVRARIAAGPRVIADLMLPRPHPQLLEALHGPRKVRFVDAFAAVETVDVSTTLEAADAAAKTGDVEIVEVRLAMGLGGHGFFTFAGDVSSVEAALDAAREVATRRGALHDSTIIPRVDPEVVKHLSKPVSPFRDFGV